MDKPESKEVAFQGVRIQIETASPVEDTLAHLRKRCGKATVAQIIEVCTASSSEAAAAKEIESRFVPESGFMIFAEIDHGGWIGRFGIERKAVRVVLGNPLIAITMLRHDLTAGLFVPVELLVAEPPRGSGSVITYVKPSSLIAISPDAELRAAAQALDDKLAALVDQAVRASAPLQHA